MKQKWPVQKVRLAENPFTSLISWVICVSKVYKKVVLRVTSHKRVIDINSRLAKKKKVLCCNDGATQLFHCV